MGIEPKNLTLSLADSTRIDEGAKNFAPFCAGRSKMVRVLVALAHA
jgi:hypothetical protein